MSNYKTFLIIFLILGLQVFRFFEPLWEQDEAAYAGFSLNILVNQEYLLPDFFLSEPHRKPPLLFYFMNGFYQIFGISEFSTRILNLVISFLFIIIFLFIIKNYESSKRNFYSLFLIIFFSMLIINIYSSIALTDYFLLLFQTLLMFFNYFFYKERKLKNRIIYLILILLSLIFGILIKGPVIILTFWITNFIFYILLFIKFKKIFYSELLL